MDWQGNVQNILTKTEKQPMIVLVDRKTDGFQDEISPDIKKFAWNGKGKKEKLDASFWPISWYPD